jgi:hypothetical protein
MRVGWLVDQTASPGGAELTQAEFRNAAPEGVEIIDCPAGQVVPGLDRYVLQNIVSYTLDDLKPLKGTPTIKYHHDVGPWMRADVWAWLRRNAQHVCCSPIQAEHMGLAAHLVPPPVDLSRFERAAESVNGSRGGAVSVASWRNYGKAPHKAAEWGSRNGGVDFFGGGELAPPGCQHVSYDSMPALLAQYQTFVFLPTVLEPFGRLVAEAWAAGCEIVTNELVGARHWIEENPAAIDTAAEDFWGLVTR